MIGLQHHVVFCFFLLLFPITGATDQPRSGNEAAVEKSTEQQGMRSLNNSDRLLIFGAIQMNTSAWRRMDCVLDIFVEIGDNIWKQVLNSNSSVFQVPVSSFGGRIGMVSIHERGGMRQRLWNHFLVVQDIGVQRPPCKVVWRLYKNKKSRECFDSVDPRCVSFAKRDGKNRQPAAFHEASDRCTTDVPCTFQFCAQYLHHQSSLRLEIYPTTTYENKAYFGMAFLEILMTFINDQLWNSGESSDWHRVFGVYFLRTWHFHCLGIVFLFLHTVNWFLRILESLSTITLSNLDPPVTADECPHILLDLEPQTSYPSSDTSFSGLSGLANIQSRHGSLPFSGDILYQDSWGDAHQYLRKLMDFPVDGSGYYYNCTAQRRSFSDPLLHSGRLSKDNNGRLIRDRPY